MTIDTQKRALALRFRFLLISFLILVIFFGLLITNILKENGPLISVFGAGLLMVYIVVHIRKYNYLWFKDEGAKIILRYYNLIPTTLSHNSIEIPKSELAGFEFRKRFFGIREELILHRKTRAGIAKYPAVSISTFRRDEKNALIHSLNEIIKPKQEVGF